MLKKFLLAVALAAASLSAFAQPYYPSGGGVVAGTTILTDCTANAVLFANASKVVSCTSKYATSDTAGAGLTITAGTATTDVAALSITRTNNNAAVATGVKIAFTDTTSASSFSPFEVFGGASATTSLLRLEKAGKLIAAGSIQGAGVYGNPGGTGLAFDGSVFYYGSSGVANWGSSQFGQDLGISRIAAGKLAVGTGAAASVAGELHAGMLQASLGTALTLTAGAIGMSKMTASGSAPGASGLKLEVVCGTNAGSAKITALAGTSTTPVTVLDNIGSGVTGC